MVSSPAGFPLFLRTAGLLSHWQAASPRQSRWGATAGRRNPRTALTRREGRFLCYCRDPARATFRLAVVLLLFRKSQDELPPRHFPKYPPQHTGLRPLLASPPSHPARHSPPLLAPRACDPRTHFLGPRACPGALPLSGKDRQSFWTRPSWFCFVQSPAACVAAPTYRVLQLDLGLRGRKTGLREKRKGTGFKILRVVRKHPRWKSGQDEQIWTNAMSQTSFVNICLSEPTLCAVYVY